MDSKTRHRLQLESLYEMFRDKVEENVIYIVYTENEGKIDVTLDQLMSIAACSFTGHLFEPEAPKAVKAPKEVNFPASKVIEFKQVETASLPSTEQEEEDYAADEENEEVELTLDERIVRLQRCIDDLLLEKKSTHDKASQYLSKKMFPVTSYYSELGSQLRRMIESKTNKLVNLLLEKSKNSNQIDLHGLNPVQARLVVSELLQIRQHKIVIDKQGEASIDIITGWGKHKVTHGHRIRPTIVALLREKGFEFHHLNRGALRVTIRRL